MTTKNTTWRKFESYDDRMEALRKNRDQSGNLERLEYLKQYAFEELSDNEQIELMELTEATK